jgi:16S rRNA (cytosine1402-N4)-methyltransferase
MVAEALRALRPAPGARLVDGTIGGAGHAEALLRASSPDGWLYGCDRDGAAIEAATERLKPFAGRFELRRGNFADLGEWIEAGSCDGALLDLGTSSAQLDEAGRGFSFQAEGPLDMRMDDRQIITAASLVNTISPEELARIFWEFGGESDSRRMAKAIALDRQQRPFETTRQLAGLIERLSPRGGRKTHPATRVFQALRIAVNQETESLRRGLEAALAILKPGGRLAVITFHSLEDRITRLFGREHARDYVAGDPSDVPELRRPAKPTVVLVEKKAIKPGEAELAENPRSRSAQLRVMEKI